MITYDGLEQKGKVYFIKFRNKLNNKISIPIEIESAKRIEKYLHTFASIEGEQVLIQPSIEGE